MILKKQKASPDGFTLLELIIVMAIVGTLGMMLVPGVQTAREASRRGGCLNNMRRWGQALQDYHSAKGHFPPVVEVPADTSQIWKHRGTWFALIFPFVEGTNISSEFEYDGLADFWFSSGYATNPINDRLMDGFVPSILACPSSPLPASYRHDRLQVGSVVEMAESSYVAVCGAALIDTTNHEPNSGFFTHISQLPKEQLHPTTYAKGQHGAITAGGMFVTGTHISRRECSDGTSNTLMVGEESNYTNIPEGREYSGGQGKIPIGPGPGDSRSSLLQSCWMGNSGAAVPHAEPFSCIEFQNRGQCQQCRNMTTILYPINWDAGNDPRRFDPRGMGRVGCNKPMRSAHPGGSLGTFADGHAAFLSEKMTMQVLSNLGNRDEGNETGF